MGSSSSSSARSQFAGRGRGRGRGNRGQAPSAAFQAILEANAAAQYQATLVTTANPRAVIVNDPFPLTTQPNPLPLEWNITVPANELIPQLESTFHARVQGMGTPMPIGTMPDNPQRPWAARVGDTRGNLVRSDRHFVRRGWNDAGPESLFDILHVPYESPQWQELTRGVTRVPRAELSYIQRWWWWLFVAPKTAESLPIVVVGTS